MVRSNLAIVIPACNEAITIGEIVRAVSPFGQAIVIDDCSHDKTATIADDNGAIVVSNPNNQGYDRSLNNGFITADEHGFEYIITFDADGQHPADYIPRFVELLDDGNDVVVGERQKKQRVSEYIFGWVMRLKYGVADPLCGMKAYRVKVFHRLGWFDSYGSIGTELVLYALKNRLRVVTVSIPSKERVDQPRLGNFSGNIKIFRAMFLGFFRP